MNIDTEKKRVQEFVDKENFHAAINIALSALNECRRNNDQAGIDQFLEMISDIVKVLSNKYGSQG